MLAQLQRWIIFGLFVSAIAWSVWWIQLGELGMTVSGVTLLIFAHAFFIGFEFVLVWFFHGDDPIPRARMSQLVKAWVAETWVALRVFCWQQPFRSESEPDHVPKALGQRGVVLIHGFVCNRGFWNRWMARLRKRNIPFVAVNLEPVFGSISDYTPILEEAVLRLERSTGLPPVLVGHSMGGLAIRTWYAKAGTLRAHRVVTIGTPHQGTWLARFGITQNAHEMVLGNAWQRTLKGHEGTQHFRRFICFYSHCDNVVFPASTATLPGADNRHLEGRAHIHMIDHPLVFQTVLDTVRSTACTKPR